jgi:hypothetical protein
MPTTTPAARIPTMLLAIVGIVGTAAPALAVPVGTTPDTRPAAPQERKQFEHQGLSFEASGTVLQGNVNMAILNTAVSYNVNWKPHQLFIDAGNLFTMAGDTVAVNRINGTGLYAFNMLDNFNLFAYTTHTHDQINKIDYRLTNGAGVCLHKLLPGFLKLGLLSAALASENEWFSQSPSQFAVRTVLRAQGIVPLTDSLDVGVDGFFTPALADVADYRLYGEAFLKVALPGNLASLKLSVADEFDTRPQPGVKNNDFGVFTTLRVDWGT